MRLLLICAILFAISISSALAQEELNKYEPEGKDSIYFAKYGQKGLDQFNHFALAGAKRLKPESTSSIEYKTPRPDLQLEFFKPKKTDMSPPDNRQCIEEGKMSLNRVTTKDVYHVKDQETTHELMVINNQCSGDIYDVANKTLQAEYDCDGHSNLQFYKDGKKLFDVNNVDKYAIYQNEFIVNISDECGNMGSKFSSYNWVTGKLISENILHTSLDDMGTDPGEFEDVVDFGKTKGPDETLNDDQLKAIDGIKEQNIDAKEIMLPNGQSLQSYVEQHPEIKTEKFKVQNDRN